MNGKVLMLAIIFFGGFHVFYVFNRVQNFANIMYRLCTIQLGECHRINQDPKGPVSFRSVQTRFSVSRIILARTKKISISEWCKICG